MSQALNTGLRTRYGVGAPALPCWPTCGFQPGSPWERGLDSEVEWGWGRQEGGVTWGLQEVGVNRVRPLPDPAPEWGPEAEGAHPASHPCAPAPCSGVPGRAGKAWTPCCCLGCTG